MIVNLTIPFPVLSNILILPKIVRTTQILILSFLLLDFLSLFPPDNFKMCAVAGAGRYGGCWCWCWSGLECKSRM